MRCSWDARGWSQKAELAVDADVDAIIWDNMLGHNAELAQ